MNDQPSSRDGQAAPDAATQMERARGLAQLAFASLSLTSRMGEGRHLALLPAETLELDLNDPVQRQFGDYELLEQIGEGGMGVVYRARQASLDREVAVKLLSAGPWASRDFIARFEREAQNAARMQHPNIVTVYEVGNVEGMHFFSMRLVRGASLSVKLKQEARCSPGAAAALIRTVAEAVDYAHNLGVLHLDLKPGNVLIDSAGVPYVTDFGLARRLENALAIENDEVSGTPAYMAPEQAQVRAQQLTPATDIWGLGAILYELLTGQPPFRADTAQDTVKLVLEGRVRSLRRFRPWIPRDLEAVVMRCLDRDPKERYPTARALADDLGRFVESRPVQARPLNTLQRTAHWARREPKLALSALLAALILVVGLLVSLQQWHRAESNAHTARANAATANQRLWDSRSAAALTLMASRNDWEAALLLLANLEEAEAQGDARRAEAARRRLGIIRNANPELIDVIPVQPIAVTVAFDAAGKRVAVSGQETGIRVFDTATGKEIVRTPAVAREVFNRLQFSPDGRVLLASHYELSAQSPRPAGRRTQRLDLATGKWMAPPSAFVGLQSASYNHDGRFAVLTAKDRRAQFWRTDPWRPLGPLAALPYDDADSARLIAPDGSGFALAGPEGAVTLVDARTLHAARVPLGRFGRVAAWAVSPDSRWIALGDPEGHVVVVDRATRAIRNLEPQSAFGARWLTFSTDGRWLALAADAGGVYLWSWPEGRLLAPPFSGNASPGGRPLAEYVELDRARNLVLVGDNTANIAVWQVAPTSVEGDLSEARRVSAAIDAAPGWGVVNVAWSPQAGLLGSVVDDRLRLERLRPPAVKYGHGAPLQPDTLRFDGRQLVEVDGNNVQVVDAMTERALGHAMHFKQPVGFAELTADGKTLVVVAGRTLHALDTASGKQRFAPVRLANSPTRVEVSPDGKRVAAAWLANDPSTDRVTSEMVVLHSLADGRRLGGPVASPGPGNEVLTFSDDGSRLLAWSPRELMLRDGVTLAPVPGPLENFRPRGRKEDARLGYVRSAAFDAAGGVEMIHIKYRKGDWFSELWRYGRDGALRAVPLPSSEFDLRLLPLPNGQGTAVAGVYSPLNRIVAVDGSILRLPDDYEDGLSTAAAASPDGRWLVRALRDGVELFDLYTHAHAAVLYFALPRPDQVWRMAFSPDGKRLLARSVRNRYVVWDLTPDPRPVAVIARGLGMRGDSGGPLSPLSDVQFTRPPDTAERASLRAGDPGGLLPELRPSDRTTGILPRDPATPVDSLDLAPQYSFGLGDPTGEPPDYADFGWVPVGLQRFQGVDFDLRGGIQLERNARARVEVAVARRVTVFHVLLADPREWTRDSGVALVLGLDYADGGHVDIPARLPEKEAYWRVPGTDDSIRPASFGPDARKTYGGDRGRGYLSTLNLANPDPGRQVRALSLRAPDDAGATPVVFAVTLQTEGVRMDKAVSASH